MGTLAKWQITAPDGTDYGQILARDAKHAVGLIMIDAGRPDLATDADGHPLARPDEWSATLVDDELATLTIGTPSTRDPVMYTIPGCDRASLLERGVERLSAECIGDGRYQYRDDGTRSDWIVDADAVADLGRQVIAADTARDDNPECPGAADPYSRWCADTDATKAPYGYTGCRCRDCFDVAMDGGFCSDCKSAECEPDSECSRVDAYGG